MRVNVKLFAPFRDLFGAAERTVELEGSPSVRALLEALCGTHDRRAALFEDSGELKSHVVVLVNGRSIKGLDGLATVLAEGDEVALFPPVGGG